ncbi:MAG: chromate transporter, partial [Methyloceanibacter sp.]
PLILVTEFVGYLAAWRDGGIALGLAGAAVSLWATFAPCFLWIFVGAPYVERLASNAKLAGALRGVTASVVGVILNLSLWFALHVIFERVEPEQHGIFRLWTPDLASFDPTAALLALLAGILLLGFRLGVLTTLAITASAALLLAALSGST